MFEGHHQSDSFSFIFLIIYFGLCYIFNSLLLWIVNSGLHVPKEKVPIDLLNNSFICPKG